jgi:hypothetical protein
MQAALSPLPSWKGDVLVNSSRQAWLEKLSASLGTACLIDQPEQRKNVMFDTPSDHIDGTEGEWLSTDYHWGLLLILPPLPP